MYGIITSHTGHQQIGMDEIKNGSPFELNLPIFHCRIPQIPIAAYNAAMTFLSDPLLRTAAGIATKLTNSRSIDLFTPHCVLLSTASGNHPPI